MNENERTTLSLVLKSDLWYKIGEAYVKVYYTRNAVGNSTRRLVIFAPKNVDIKRSDLVDQEFVQGMFNQRVSK